MHMNYIGIISSFFQSSEKTVYTMISMGPREH